MVPPSTPPALLPDAAALVPAPCGTQLGAGELRRQARETALMARFRDVGGEEAFAALYEVARAPLQAWITRRAGRRTDPLEILQDAFVNIVRYAGGFRDESPQSFRRWSRTIAANALKRSCRRRETFGPGFVALTDDFPEVADDALGPVAGAIAREDGESLVRAWNVLLLHYAAAFETLGERDRRALRLIEVEGRSYEAARRELGVELSNMKMIVFRARQRLRERLHATLGGALARPHAA